MQIPRQDAATVSPINASGANYQRIDTNPDMFGASIGRALEEVGQGINSVANAFGKIGASMEAGQKEKDAATVNNTFTNALVDLGGVEADYSTTEGQGAVDGLSTFTTKVQEIRQKYLESLPTEALRKSFDEQYSRRAAYSIVDAQKHAATGLKDMTLGASKGRIESVYNDAAIKANDDNLFAENLGALDKEVQLQAQVKGWSADETAANRRTFHSGAWSVRIQQIALADPAAAQRMLNANRDQLTADDLPKVENTVHAMLMNRQSTETINKALNGGDPTTVPRTTAAIAGDDAAGQFLMGRRAPDSGAMRPDAISGLQPEFRSGLASLIQAAPPDIAKGLGIYSGYRSPAVQAVLWRNAVRKYGSEKAARHWVAPPGHSQHNFGRAADLSWNGGSLANAPPAVVQWVHDNAAKYGLNFRLEHEQWHIELAKGGDEPRYTPSTAAGGQSLIGRVIMSESGGKSGLVSPKGALGTMQVMPETGRLVANMLGIPFSAERLRTDPQYNMLIGQTYLGMMLRRYSGNQALAVAAYNAGPGRVDRWIKTIGDPRSGNITDAQWAASIPIDETRNYTTKIIGASGPGMGPGPIITATSSVADMTAAMDRGSAYALQDTGGVFDPVYDEQIRSGIRTQWLRQKQEADAAHEEVYGEVKQAAYGPDGNNGPQTQEELLTTDRMKQLWSQLTPEDRRGITNILASNAKPEVTWTPAGVKRFQELSGMSVNQPEQFLKLDLSKEELIPKANQVELAREQANIVAANKKAVAEAAEKTAAENKKIAEANKKIADDAAEAKAKILQKSSDVSKALSVLGPSLIAAGIDPTPLPKDLEGAAKLNQFIGAYSAAQQAEITRNGGKELTDDEIRKIGSDLLRVTPGSHSFFTPWTNTPDQFQFEIMQKQHGNFDATFDAEPILTVPPADHDQIRDAYTRKFGTPPSEEMIGIYYMRRKLRERQ